MSSGGPRPPDLEALGLLIAVAEMGSLGRAAARYGVTQPAVSLRMRELERSLGVVLLDRTPTGSTLTPQGAPWRNGHGRCWTRRKPSRAASPHSPSITKTGFVSPHR